MKYKILSIFFLLSIFSLVNASHAIATCPTNFESNGYTASTVCALASDTIYVIDNGLTEGSTTNTATLAVNASTITVSTGSILNVGTITLGGGTIALQGTGRIELGPRWVGGETDADGYTDNLTTLYTATAAGRRRISLMKSKTTTDCNGAATGYNYTLPSTYYVDADQDTFTVSSQAGVTGICSNQSTWDTTTSTTVPGGAIGTAVSFNAGTRRTAASGITDCDDAQGTVKYPHTACYWDNDGDNYTNGNVAGKTCLSHSTCATSTSASLGGGVAPTPYTAGLIEDSASGTADCLDSDANVRTKNATGGTITNITGYRVHTFTSGTSTFTITCGGTTTVEYLVVAGGASGGSSKVSWGGGGGGGAGGYLAGTMSATQSTGYTATVGAGGVARAVSSNLAGANGGNSVFSSFTAIGGGGGGQGGGAGASVAVAGGSGGGSGHSPDLGPYWTNTAGAAGTAGQGYAGGAVCRSNAGAGGGGAGSVGEDVSKPGCSTWNTVAGNGGLGNSSSITGSTLYYSVGGAGGAGLSSTSGAANTGNGGSGAYAQNAASGAGGSGIVIVRYANP